MPVLAVASFKAAGKAIPQGRENTLRTRAGLTAAIRVSVQDAVSSFVVAERFVETLLARQEFVSTKGLKCYAE